MTQIKLQLSIDKIDEKIAEFEQLKRHISIIKSALSQTTVKQSVCFAG